MRRLFLAMVTLGALLAPGASGFVDTCGSAGVLVAGRGVCTEVTVDNPFGFVPSPLFPQLHRCPTWTMGGNVSYNGSWVSLCASVNVTESPRLTPAVSIVPCGPGYDPAVAVLYTEVLICVLRSHRVQPVERPPINLHPCPGGFDPRVQIGGTVIVICVVIVPRS